MTHNDVVRPVEWALLIAQLPAQDGIPAGILLLDPASDELHIKLLSELTGADADQEAAEFWRELPQDLMERSRELGGSRLLDWLETTASHFIELGSRTSIETSNPQETLDLLYRTHVIDDLELQQPAARELRRGAGH
jgi:hypothetical protein